MRQRTPFSRAAALGSALMCTALLAGCAKLGTDHIEVGSIPDDYRTRHPIVIGEMDKKLAVPVTGAARDMSFAEKEVVRGFLSSYNTSGSGAIQILVPAGHPGAGAAGHAANQIVSVAQERGIAGHALIGSYAPTPDMPTPPVFVIYKALVASAGPCGKWTDNILPSPDNKQYHNFGCSVQNNLAAQVANPMDLLYPRQIGPIDAADRDAVIRDYRENVGSWEKTIDY
jgi:pilus assembly protein CpaD